MQHGTGREKVIDVLENVQAVLEGGRKRNGWPVSDCILALVEARKVLEGPVDIDERGAYGPDYPTPTVSV